jgi:hypothetical protein
MVVSHDQLMHLRLEWFVDSLRVKQKRARDTRLPLMRRRTRATHDEAAYANARFSTPPDEPCLRRCPGARIPPFGREEQPD